MIRQASIADCEAAYRLICELENRALPRERFCEIFREQLADARYRCLVCEQDGEVSGLLNLRFEAQLHHAERIAEILEFVVSSERRGQGLGRELLRYAEQLARGCGCAQVEAASNRHRTDAPASTCGRASRTATSNLSSSCKGETK